MQHNLIIQPILRTLLTSCVGIVTRVAVVACVWKYECFVMQMLYVCVVCASCGSSQLCMTCWSRMQSMETILKPGKDSAIPKSYRSISLLCHMYKLYKHLIRNRTALSINRHLIKEQAGFRPRKSCCSQLLNLTQHIDDGYQRGMITGAAFVDISAAYDTVNHRLLIQKLYDFTEDSPLYKVIQK